MVESASRRNFLKIAAGVAGGVTGGMALTNSERTAAARTSTGVFAAGAGAGALSGAVAPSGSINVRITDSSRKFAAAPAIEWHAGESNANTGAAEGNAITVAAAKTYQEHLGFGGAFTDAACFTFNRLSGDARAALFHEMFDPKEMGLGAGRVCIGSSDYSTKMYSYDEGEPDPELSRFSIEHDRAYILPILREVRRVNPDFHLLASPWSPPGWMKPNGSMLGGCMHRKTMAPYAKYFVKFLQSYAAEGVHINAVTSQNEVDTEQDSNMPACAWPQEYEMSFVSDHLGPALAAAGLDTAVWLLDHNYNLWGRAICSLDNPEVRRYCHAVAWHGYVGTPEMIGRVHEAHPEVEMFWTEGGPDVDAKDYATDWCNWGGTFTGAMRNWCRAIIGWNLALDETGHPNIGPFRCGGTVTIDSRSAQISRSGHFWATSHFSRSVRRGARRVESAGGPSAVQHVAYIDANAGSRTVLLLTNSGKTTTARIQVGGVEADVELPQDSLVTLSWS